jgi:hypothetical protein
VLRNTALTLAPFVDGAPADGAPFLRGLNSAAGETRLRATCEAGLRRLAKPKRPPEAGNSRLEITRTTECEIGGGVYVSFNGHDIKLRASRPTGYDLIFLEGHMPRRIVAIPFTVGNDLKTLSVGVMVAIRPEENSGTLAHSRFQEREIIELECSRLTFPSHRGC